MASLLPSLCDPPELRDGQFDRHREECSMDFTLPPKVEELRRRVSAFMDQNVYPAEKIAEQQVHDSDDPHRDPPVLVELRKKAKADGLWNLFMPDDHYGKGLKNWEYAPLCEIMGRSRIGARAFNCQAPDTGNMEILAEFGTPEQKKRWLEPCLEGTMRTSFSMTEPDTAGSDPTQLKSRAVRDGDDYVINGHKWFTSGAYGAGFAIGWWSLIRTRRSMSAPARSSFRSTLPASTSCARCP
jgi:acyl-CoA dehydrogenase